MGAEDNPLEQRQTQNRSEWFRYLSAESASLAGGDHEALHPRATTRTEVALNFASSS
jgi:hypothetical protein